MRVRPLILALAGLALVVPEARADGLLDGARKGVRGGRQAPAPMRTPQPRSSGGGFFGGRDSGAPAPRQAPRVQAPRPAPARVARPTFDRAPSGGRTVLGGGQRNPAPAPAARPSNGFFRDRGDEAPAPRAPARVPSTVRRSTTLSDDGFFRDRGGVQRRPAVDRDGPARDRTPGFRGNAGKPEDRARPSAPPPAATTATGTTTVTGGTGGHAGGGSGFLDRAGDRLRNGSNRPAGGPGGGGSVGGFGSRRTGGGSVASTTTVSSDLYRSAWRNGYRVGTSNAGYGWYHDWYDSNRWYLSFSFGSSCGPFFGVSYYRPFHSFVLGLDYAFFYPAPVSYCYVPYGFYCGATPYYVTRYQYVRAPVVVYEERVTYSTEEIEGRAPAATGADAPGDEPKVADPLPAAGSPATEKFLREASDHFRKKEYYEAAVQFRLAALSSPELPGPLFALGQSLLAMGQDAYAARVTRKAVEMSPKMLEETGDVAGVFADQAEFDRVLKELEARAEAAPVDGDARFLLAAERFFTGDVRCREGFDALHVANPMDEAVDLFRAAAARRFKAAEELPAIPR